jgi:hypothetical protein
MLMPDKEPEETIPIPIPGLGKRGLRISEMALLLMLAGILFPAATYSYKLHDPTPAQLLVAICITLFSGVVFLWILDATSVIRFRSEWVSRSIYGAAIVSVLGTSVAVYKDAFGARPYPYEGRWQLVVLQPPANKILANHNLLLIFSESAGEYWGYSELAPKDSSSDKAAWVEVLDFTPQDRNLKLRLVSQTGSETIIQSKLVAIGKSLRSEASANYQIDLSRVK